MAFESLPGVKVTSHAAEQTFVVGDFFAVYLHGEENPTIYRWTEVKTITESRTDFIIHVAGVAYRIPKFCLPDEKKLLNLRGILEGAVSFNPKIEYVHQKRILPPKYLYISGDPGDVPYTVNGFYKEREINLSNAILLNTRLRNVFKLITLISILSVFAYLHFSWGDTEDKWFWYLPISVFSGGIIVMLVYLVCALIANFHYSQLYKTDPALSEEITFSVSTAGFSAVESHLQSGNEFIPWGEANYFIETNNVFIVYKHNKAVFWLPKRLFSKEIQTEISGFIHERLVQK
ncbi:MAG: YcxB family protein [Oscillospiraceae bacterium]|nr:YcxB family protein [Oscillospiraceae bacterium]